MTTWNIPGPAPVLMEDPIIHTKERPFCNDIACPCHHDLELHRELWLRVQNHEITARQAIAIYWSQEEEQAN